MARDTWGCDPLRASLSALSWINLTKPKVSSFCVRSSNLIICSVTPLNTTSVGHCTLIVTVRWGPWSSPDLSPRFLVDLESLRLERLLLSLLLLLRLCLRCLPCPRDRWRELLALDLDWPLVWLVARLDARLTVTDSASPPTASCCSSRTTRVAMVSWVVCSSASLLRISTVSALAWCSLVPRTGFWLHWGVAGALPVLACGHLMPLGGRCFSPQPVQTKSLPLAFLVGILDVLSTLQIELSGDPWNTD